MKHARIVLTGVTHDATERDGQLLLADGRARGARRRDLAAAAERPRRARAPSSRSA